MSFGERHLAAAVRFDSHIGASAQAAEPWFAHLDPHSQQILSSNQGADICFDSPIHVDEQDEVDSLPCMIDIRTWMQPYFEYRLYLATQENIWTVDYSHDCDALTGTAEEHFEECVCVIAENMVCKRNGVVHDCVHRNANYIHTGIRDGVCPYQSYNGADLWQCSMSMGHMGPLFAGTWQDSKLDARGSVDGIERAFTKTTLRDLQSETAPLTTPTTALRSMHGTLDRTAATTEQIRALQESTGHVWFYTGCRSLLRLKGTRDPTGTSPKCGYFQTPEQIVALAELAHEVCMADYYWSDLLTCEANKALLEEEEAVFANGTHLAEASKEWELSTALFAQAVQQIHASTVAAQTPHTGRGINQTLARRPGKEIQMPKGHLLLLMRYMITDIQAMAEYDTDYAYACLGIPAGDPAALLTETSRATFKRLAIMLHSIVDILTSPFQTTESTSAELALMELFAIANTGPDSPQLSTRNALGKNSKRRGAGATTTGRSGLSGALSSPTSSFAAPGSVPVAGALQLLVKAINSQITTTPLSTACKRFASEVDKLNQAVARIKEKMRADDTDTTGQPYFSTLRTNAGDRKRKATCAIQLHPATKTT